MDVSYSVDYPTIPAGRERKLHLLVRIETWPEEGGKTRKPLNVALVIDRSSSMSGEKLERTKEAALALVERLGPDDVLSIVTYSDAVDVPLKPTPVTDKHLFSAAIQGISARGNTNLSAGWLRGLSLLGERAGQDYLHRAILLTDGEANEGVTDEEGLREIARQYKATGLATTTIGFGTTFNESLLGAIAQEGGGRFHYVRSPDEAPGVFLEEFGQLVRVFGQNLEVRIEAAEGVKGPEVFGESGARLEERIATVAVGDVRERDRKQVLAALTVPKDLPTGEAEIATLQVAYDAVRGKIGRRQHVLSVTVNVTPKAEEEAKPDQEVLLEIALHEITGMKQEAIRAMDAGDVDGASGWLERALRLVDQRCGLSVPGESETPEVLAREKKALEDLVAQLKRAKGLSKSGSATPGVRRQLRDARITMESHVMSSSAHRERLRQRGPNVDVQKYSLAPDTKEVLEDIVDATRKTLSAFGHAGEFADRSEGMIRELTANALEHGCKGLSEPRVEVETRCSRNYFKVIVEDNGKGFDVQQELARDAASAAGLAHPRGRGLFTVKKLADQLEFNDKGNRVSAMLGKERFDVGVDETTALSAGGVGKIGVIKVEGSIDGHTFGKFASTIEDSISRDLVGLIVDLSDCRYMSSVGIGTLCEACATVEEVGGRLVVVGVQRRVCDVLELTGVMDLFAVADTVEDARKLLEAP